MINFLEAYNDSPGIAPGKHIGLILQALRLEPPDKFGPAAITRAFAALTLDASQRTAIMMVMMGKFQDGSASTVCDMLTYILYGGWNDAGLPSDVTPLTAEQRVVIYDAVMAEAVAVLQAREDELAEYTTSTYTIPEGWNQ